MNKTHRLDAAAIAKQVGPKKPCVPHSLQRAAGGAQDALLCWQAGNEVHRGSMGKHKAWENLDTRDISDMVGRQG